MNGPRQYAHLLRLEMTTNVWMPFLAAVPVLFISLDSALRHDAGESRPEFWLMRSLETAVPLWTCMFVAFTFRPDVLLGQEGVGGISEIVLSRAVPRRLWYLARATQYALCMAVLLTPVLVDALRSPDIVLSTSWSGHERYVAAFPDSRVLGGAGGSVQVVLPAGRWVVLAAEAWVVVAATALAQILVFGAAALRLGRAAAYALLLALPLVWMKVLLSRDPRTVDQVLLVFLQHWPAWTLVLVVAGVLVQIWGLRQFEQMEVA